MLDALFARHLQPEPEAGVRQPEPSNNTDLLSGNGDNVSFTLAVTGSNQKQRLQITATNAAIAALGIKGGNDTTVYDYTGLQYGSGASSGQGWVAADSNLHAPASKYPSVSVGGTKNPRSGTGSAN